MLDYPVWIKPTPSDLSDKEPKNLFEMRDEEIRNQKTGKNIILKDILNEA